MLAYATKYVKTESVCLVPVDGEAALEAPTRLLTAGLFNLLLKGFARSVVPVGLLNVKRLVVVLGDGVVGGKVLLVRGGKVTLKANIGEGDDEEDEEEDDDDDEDDDEEEEIEEDDDTENDDEEDDTTGEVVEGFFDSVPLSPLLLSIGSVSISSSTSTSARSSKPIRHSTRR